MDCNAMDCCVWGLATVYATPRAGAFARGISQWLNRDSTARPVNFRTARRVWIRSRRLGLDCATMQSWLEAEQPSRPARRQLELASPILVPSAIVTALDVRVPIAASRSVARTEMPTTT